MFLHTRGQGGWRGLALVLVLCAGLTLMHQQRIRGGRPDPVVGAVRDAALVPSQTLLFGLGHWWQSHLLSLSQGMRLVHDNERLQAQLEALRAENSELRTAQAENDRLRQALAFEKRSSRHLLAAEVIALKPTLQTDTLILNRGRGDNVQPQEVVLSADGALVGQVLDVPANITQRSCTVLLLTDSGSSVGAEVVRPGAKPGQGAPRIGICRGDRADHLTLTFPRIDADVRLGDRVVTSGLGGVFPKGLPVGVVAAVSTDKTRSVKTATVRPSVDFDHLEQAFLVP